MRPYIFVSFTLLFNLNSFSQDRAIDSLKLALKNAKHDTTRCNILNTMIEAEDDFNIWPKYNEELMKLAESKLKLTHQKTAEYKFYQKKIAAASTNFGYLAQNKGDIQNALACFGRSLIIAEELADKENIAISLNNIGFIYDDQGDIPKALEYFGKSIKIREEIGDKRGLANSFNNIATIFNNQGDIAKALDYFQRSMKIHKELGNKKGIAEVMGNIGYIYNKQGNYPGALDCFLMSSKIQEEIGDKIGLAYSLNNLGSLYNVQGDPLIKSSREDALSAGIIKAMEYYSRSIKIREELGDKEGITQSLICIGLIYHQKKNYPKALEFYLRSMKISKELGYPENIRNAAMKLNQIYKAIGNYKLALENHELFIQMRDSINNLETQKASIQQQTQYEFEKKKAVDDEKHQAELKVQEEKAQADKKRQNIVIGSVSLVLLLVAFFSVLLYKRFKTTQKQKLIIELKEKETQNQKDIIEEKQKEILDSINYAKRIQYTLLAHEEFLKENLPEHFTFFNPKDIVSGDFYWATKHNNKFYLAVCDSTGHGVPGAFMSLLNIGFLTEAINEKGIEKPNEVFDYVRLKLTSTISKEGQKDGFDGILVCFDQKSKSITYAAANNAPIIIKKGPVAELVEAPDDRMPVGVGERKENFTLHTIEAKPGDMMYLYTDGYADQFGGPIGKKFKYKQLNELLISMHTKTFVEQHAELKNVFLTWKGNLEQVDDVCVIGIRL